MLQRLLLSHSQVQHNENAVWCIIFQFNAHFHLSFIKPADISHYQHWPYCRKTLMDQLRSSSAAFTWTFFLFTPSESDHKYCISQHLRNRATGRSCLLALSSITETLPQFVCVFGDGYTSASLSQIKCFTATAAGDKALAVAGVLSSTWSLHFQPVWKTDVSQKQQQWA